MQYKNSSICYIHGEPTSRAHMVFSFSLIKQQKTKTKQGKPNTTNIGTLEVISVPAPSPLSRPSSQTYDPGVTISLLQGAERG